MQRATSSMIFTLTLFLLLPAPSQAQHWNAAEQEVLDFTEACWERFVEEDIEAYLSECVHDGYTRWYSGAAMPFDANSERRILPPWFSRNDWAAWDLQPHRIMVSGDAAVIHYQLSSFRTATDGSTSFHTSGRSDFLVREGGRWKVFSVHEHDAGG